MTRFGPIFLSILLAVPAMGQAKGKFTVEAGEAARGNQPLEAKLPAGIDLAPGVYDISPEGADSAAWTAQVERTKDGAIIRWIESNLPAGSHRTYEIFPHNAGGEMFTFTIDDAQRDLLFGKRPVLRDMIKYDSADRENTYKTYTH